VLKQSNYILFFVLFCLPFVSVQAAPDYNFDELTNVLQSEYRSQLKQQSRKNQQTKPVRPRSPAPRVVKPVQRKPAPRVIPRPRQAHVNRQLPPRQRYQPPSNEPPEPRALFNAASSGNNQMIARLLEEGININTANNERETALHMAAAHGHYSTVIYLINHGAYLHARTIKNWMPLHHATRFRHANIVNYLKQRGASPYARTSDGLSAIDMAKSVGDKRLLHVLVVQLHGRNFLGKLGEKLHILKALLESAEERRETLSCLSDEELAPKANLVKQFVPEIHGNCEFIQGGSAAELADNLIKRLREESLLQ
jgi:hypothetical protein